MSILTSSGLFNLSLKSVDSFFELAIVVKGKPKSLSKTTPLIFLELFY